VLEHRDRRKAPTPVRTKGRDGSLGHPHLPPGNRPAPTTCFRPPEAFFSPLKVGHKAQPTLQPAHSDVGRALRPTLPASPSSPRQPHSPHRGRPSDPSLPPPIRDGARSTSRCDRIARRPTCWQLHDPNISEAHRRTFRLQTKQYQDKGAVICLVVLNLRRGSGFTPVTPCLSVVHPPSDPLTPPRTTQRSVPTSTNPRRRSLHHRCDLVARRIT